MRVAIVGVCGSGKSELARRLGVRGIDVHAIAQEHSHVQDLWQHGGVPDLLVYLGASARTVRRRGKVGLESAELHEQRRRLAHARRHAHVRLCTDALLPREVEEHVLRHLAARYTATNR